MFFFFFYQPFPVFKLLNPAMCCNDNIQCSYSKGKEEGLTQLEHQSNSKSVSRVFNSLSHGGNLSSVIIAGSLLNMIYLLHSVATIEVPSYIL